MLRLCVYIYIYNNNNSNNNNNNSNSSSSYPNEGVVEVETDETRVKATVWAVGGVRHGFPHELLRFRAAAAFVVVTDAQALPRGRRLRARESAGALEQAEQGGHGFERGPTHEAAESGAPPVARRRPGGDERQQHH